MAGDTRKYRVRHYDDTGNIVRERVIEAQTRAAARAHASNTTIGVELLTADDALRLGAAGVQTEIAGAKVDPDKGVDPDQQTLPIVSEPTTGPAPKSGAAIDNFLP